MYVSNRGLGSSTAPVIGAAVSTAIETASLFTGPAAPFVMAIGAIAGPIIAMFQGCGATCTQATAYVNQAGQALDQIFHAYMSAPVRTQSMQAAALQQIQAIFSAMQQACSNPALGQAGQDCISQRLDPNACTMKASPGSWNQNAQGQWTWTYYGPEGSGSACWNFVLGYYDPIASDPGVVPDSSAPGAAGSIALGGSIVPYLAIGLIAAALLLR